MKIYGAKLGTETLEAERPGKEAYGMARSMFENSYGPCHSENPGISNIIYG